MRAIWEWWSVTLPHLTLYTHTHTLLKISLCFGLYQHSLYTHSVSYLFMWAHGLWAYTWWIHPSKPSLLLDLCSSNSGAGNSPGTVDLLFSFLPLKQANVIKIEGRTEKYKNRGKRSQDSPTERGGFPRGDETAILRNGWQTRQGLSRIWLT